ncbi:MAG: DNA cytosine methyltransferase, partial [Spiroplasma sp.]
MYVWKNNFFEKNRKFYLKNQKLIDQWFFKYKDFLNIKKTYRKFEWNAGNKISSIKEGIIQFRHSGLRVKKPNFFPTLVKMVHTPIIWDKKEEKYRYISIEEALALQNFPISGKDAFIFPNDSSESEAFKRIGNSINVEVISKILDYFL